MSGVQHNAIADADRHPVKGADGATAGHVYTSDGAGDATFQAPGAPSAHATSHENGGTDEISVAGLSGVLADPQRADTLATPANVAVSGGIGANGDVLTSDGLGGATFQPPSGGGSSDPRATVVHDHFVSGNTDTDELGKHGWRIVTSGVGTGVSIIGVSGRPGVAELGSGTASNGYTAIHLGLGSTANFLIGGSNTITFEISVAQQTSVIAADLEQAVYGICGGWGTAGPPQNGVYVTLRPATSPNWLLVVASGGVEQVSDSGVSPTPGTWTTLAIEISNPTSSPSAQLKINGTNQGAAITTGFPGSALGVGAKIDSAGGSLCQSRIDYILVTQAPE